jgi:hypothetical protein
MPTEQSSWLCLRPSPLRHPRGGRWWEYSNFARWLTRYAALDVACDRWDATTYGDYLDQMRKWATGLSCRPDDLELLIFEATVEGQCAKE